MGISKFIHAVKKSQYLAIVLKESDDRLVKASQLLVRFIATGIMSRAAVKDIAATIARVIFGYPLTIGETKDFDYQLSLCIVF